MMLDERFRISTLEQMMLESGVIHDYLSASQQTVFVHQDPSLTHSYLRAQWSFTVGGQYFPMVAGTAGRALICISRRGQHYDGSALTRTGACYCKCYSSPVHSSDTPMPAQPVVARSLRNQALPPHSLSSGYWILTRLDSWSM